ncbi:MULTISPECIES: hypothetical protein [Pseudomonas]|uniref:Uncharacterized protein n=1 Tax=Pseudomonas fluorescens TaxID=294 RepID=A0A161ZF97_PSEFL|nr:MULTISPECIES: hypothetical protein [Pseudomonas]KZN20552.1 hypothetical protein A1D17_03145 [Pseudomonas fluorescens]
MSQPQQPKLTFAFLSAYKGTQDFCVHLADASKPRLSVRYMREWHEDSSGFSAEEFERRVNGNIGFITTGDSEILTAELVAAFNRYQYEEHKGAESTILANPKVYGAYEPKPYQVVVGGRFDSTSREWVPLHTFEEIYQLAGIPADQCVDAVQSARAVLAQAA